MPSWKLEKYVSYTYHHIHKLCDAFFSGHSIRVLPQLLSAHQSTDEKKTVAAVMKTQNSQARWDFIFNLVSFQFSSVQSLSPVRLFATPWAAACQASLSITNSESLLKLMSIELMMPSNRLILMPVMWWDTRPIISLVRSSDGIRPQSLSGWTRTASTTLLASDSPPFLSHLVFLHHLVLPYRSGWTSETMSSLSSPRGNLNGRRNTTWFASWINMTHFYIATLHPPEAHISQNDLCLQRPRDLAGEFP